MKISTFKSFSALFAAFCFLALCLPASAQEDNGNNTASSTGVSHVKDYDENYAFEDPKDRKTFLELTAVLRCPMCQNQNIADSDAMIAHDMRRKVYNLLKEGNSKQDVIDFMKERYGDFVYYQPPVTPVTVWLWALPVIFAFVMMGVFIYRRKTEVPQQDIAAKLDAADKLLKDE
ncbi:cytochrome c-type biogenesis protein [Brumicola blandensis]|uniref:Cytochrome c-type biogenesis protein n=1 Tax=Brumicola blandensis TaxID=3075611 RepID=A0AAW8R1S7_9ALTE|nr:cytochrome c-type biogenesis protein [Alteromonas sp. W409]MDT0582679.1 cytochrome c-type biogenesis protein [Alteromonas sp. W409]